MTSHDVVDLISPQTRDPEKVGHCGTLDPIATGSLLLTIGTPAPRSQGLLMSEDKEYAGTLLLGITTSTQDRQGGRYQRAAGSGIKRE